MAGNTENKKDEKAEKKRRKISLNRVWQGCLLAVASIVFFCVFFGLTSYLFGLFGQTVSKTTSLIDSFIKEEQLEYVSESKSALSDIEENIWLVDEYMQILEEGDELDSEEKRELYIELRRLEEDSILLERKFEAYFDDISIQFCPRASDEITTYIYETGNLVTALNRFVRSVELMIFLPEGSGNQDELVLENYYEVLWYLDQF